MDANLRTQLKSYCDEVLARWKGLNLLINKPDISKCIKALSDMEQWLEQMLESWVKQQAGVILIVLE
jgi:hypothetical protein